MDDALDSPIPLETTDPELADLLVWWVNGGAEDVAWMLKGQVRRGWDFLDRSFLEVCKDVGRNDLCPCGSLLKSKRCCLR